MPSPFPGMNPYLERADVWPMFHSQFVSAMQQSLAHQVRPKYIAKMDMRVYIHEPPAADRLIGEPDVGISRTRPPTDGENRATIAAPLYGTIPAWVEFEKSRYLEIRDRASNRVVTVIELLSPSNKYSGPDREQYIAKRNLILYSRSHLVEIDFLRGGPRMPVDGLPRCDYCAVVGRVEDWPRVGIWAWHLRDSLPVIPIPLSDGDPDAQLDLKAILDQVYDGGCYGDYIYAGPPEPRLAPDDDAWAKGFLPAQPQS